MSTTYDYYYYVTNDNGDNKLCVVYDDGSSTGNYTGAATVYYTKLEDIDTSLDTNTPTIDERWHWAIVYGALFLAGRMEFHRLFMDYVKRARASNGRSGNGTLVLFHY